MVTRAALNAVATSLADSPTVVTTVTWVTPSGRVTTIVPSSMAWLKTSISVTLLPALPSAKLFCNGSAPETPLVAVALLKPDIDGPDMLMTPPTGAGAVGPYAG